MIDLIRTQQLDIMLSLGSMCAIISFFIVMTGMNTKKKKAIFILELSAAVLLISARLTWIYNGMPDNFSKVMSAISNFLDFICVPIVIFGFNMYIKEMLSEAEGPGQNPMSFRIIDILLALDSICICLSPFTGLCYFLDENNVYNRGPAVSVCFAVPLIILLIQIFLILRHYKKLSHRTRLPVLLFVIVPFPASVLQFCFYGLETTNITIVAMAILLYLFDLSDINKSAEMSARAIAANEAKSSFLSNMSHEIRSQLDFNKADNSGFIRIFSMAVTPHAEQETDRGELRILTVDDLSIEIVDGYDYYGYGEHKDSETYNEIYRERIKKMDAE